MDRTSRIPARHIWRSIIATLRTLPAISRSAFKRKRVVSWLVAFCLLITVTLPPPQTVGSYAGRVSTRTEAIQSKWLPQVNVARNVLSLVNWLSEKVSHSFKHVAPGPAAAAYLSPLPPFLDAPTNLNVTAASQTSISMSWTAPAGTIDHYQVERSPRVNGPFLFLANSTTTTFLDNSVTAGNGYLYRVRAIGIGGIFSTPSNMALGTAVSFEFSQLQGQPIKAQHIYDIRTAINAVRAVANLPAASWTLSNLANLGVQAAVVQELRDALGPALTALAINVAGYTDPTLTAGATLIKATLKNCKRGPHAAVAAVSGRLILTHQVLDWIR